VDDTLAIYDIMKFLTCDIATYCIGRAESGGAVVFAAGKKGKRYILPNAKVMIHQPFGGVYGQTADIEIQAEEILKTKNTLINVLAKCTGQTADRVREDSERDRFFDAKQAVEYGLCDEVIGERCNRGCRPRGCRRGRDKAEGITTASRCPDSRGRKAPGLPPAANRGGKIPSIASTDERNRDRSSVYRVLRCEGAGGMVCRRSV